MKFDDLLRLLTEEEPADRLRERERELFALLPPLAVCRGFRQNNPWHIYDVYDHILKVVEGVPPTPISRLAALFHDIGKPEVYHEDKNGVGHFYGHWERSALIFAAFVTEHGLPASLAEPVERLIRYHDINFARLEADETDRLLRLFSEEELCLLFALKRADLLAQNPAYHGLLQDYDRLQAAVLAQKRAQHT